MLCRYFGWQPEYVLSLGMDEVASILESYDRLQAAETLDTAILHQVAAQGDSKAMKSFTSPFYAALGMMPPGAKTGKDLQGS